MRRLTLAILLALALLGTTLPRPSEAQPPPKTTTTPRDTPVVEPPRGTPGPVYLPAITSPEEPTHEP